MKKNSRVENIDVSVIIVSYNHEKYIKEAIESVLMQKTSLMYEILFADDCSTDNTIQIIKELAEKIKYKQFLFSKQNHGNTYNTFHAYFKCRGKYIIVLEGDDYWCWEEKLQTQFDFLESNPKYIGVSDRRCEINKNKEIITSEPNIRKDKDFELNDFLHLHFYSNVETMFRNIFKKEDKKVRNLFLGDRMILDVVQCIYLLRLGKIRVLNQGGGIYRTSTSGNVTNYNSMKKLIDISRDHINILNRMDRFYKEEIDLRVLYGYYLFPVFATVILHGNFREYNEIKKLINKKYLRYFKIHFLKYVIFFMNTLRKKIYKTIKAK